MVKKTSSKSETVTEEKEEEQEIFVNPISEKLSDKNYLFIRDALKKRDALFPKLKEQLLENGADYKQHELQDKELEIWNRTFDEEKEHSRTITSICRLMNRKTGKEMVYWYEKWDGFKQSGDLVNVGDIPFGIDKNKIIIPKVDAKGLPLEPEVSPDTYNVYYIEWSPELFDEILKYHVPEESRQIQMKVKDYSEHAVFDIDNFKNMPFAELFKKAKTGEA